MKVGRFIDCPALLPRQRSQRQSNKFIDRNVNARPYGLGDVKYFRRFDL